MCRTLCRVTQDEAPKWLRFGVELRKLRTYAGVSQLQLSSKLMLSRSLISGFERGTRHPNRDQAELLDRVLDTGGVLTRLWGSLANQDIYPEWFNDVVAMERESVEIREYQSILVPGLVQTAQYAEALTRASRPWADTKQVRHAVDSRVKRQEILRDGGPLVWFVVDEIVIRRAVGSAEIMRDQLDQMLRLMDKGLIRLQVIPTGTLHHPGLCTPFRIMTFATQPPVAYAERLKGGDVIDAAGEVRECNTIFGALQAEALSPSASAEMIQQVRGGS